MNKHTIIYDTFPQNTPPWEHVRLGMVTGSDFNLLLRRGKVKGGESVTRRNRVHDCAHELLTGERADNTWKGNRFTERGHAQEKDAVELYVEMMDGRETLSFPAFIKDKHLRTGVSPDALVGSDGGLEVKTMAGGLFLQLKRNPRVPPEHAAQLQACLMVTERSWWDLMVYSPPHTPLIMRVHPDRSHMADLKAGLIAFNREVDEVVLMEGKTVQTCQESLEARLSEVVDEWHESQSIELTPLALSELSSDGDGGQ